MRRQGGAEATCGAQVQLTHLQAQNQVSCHATEPVSCIYQDKKASTTMPMLPMKDKFSKTRKHCTLSSLLPSFHELLHSAPHAGYH